MQRRAVASSLNSDLPLGGSHVTSYGKGSMTNKKSSNGILSIVFVILLLGTSAMLITEKNKSKDLQDRLLLLQDEHDQVSKQSASKSAELSRVKAEKEKLARENTSVTEKAADHKGKLEDTEKSQQEVIKRLNALQSEVQRHSKHDVLEQFGEGPYRVEFTLDFPPMDGESEAKEGPSVFVAEMAPLDLMPHSVHLFLEMVGHGLLDGTSFHRNAHHVVQAGPTPYYKSKGQNLRSAFVQNRLTSVSFQEYHPEFPHEKYTMGFAGRPGGPDWYVSTVDNTQNHGPGGQSSYALPGEADPCFAKVISGFDAVDRVHGMPIQPGWYNAMEKNVGIAKARILPKEEL